LFGVRVDNVDLTPLFFSTLNKIWNPTIMKKGIFSCSFPIHNLHERENGKELNGHIRAELIIPDLTAANSCDAIQQLVDRVLRSITAN
jgi:hypothetical protein